jgi:hypothetical protein
MIIIGRQIGAYSIGLTILRNLICPGKKKNTLKYIRPRKAPYTKTA